MKQDNLKSTLRVKIKYRINKNSSVNTHQMNRWHYVGAFTEYDEPII